MDPSRSDRRAFLRAALVGGAALAVGACKPSSGASASYYDKEEIAYGPDKIQVGTLTIPTTTRARPVAALIHGGYWRNSFTSEAMVDLSKDLARYGWAAWNLDYRRVGDPGGGYPGTLEDIALGVDKLVELAPQKNLDLDRFVVIGHSAGSQLALWAAARHKLPPGAPGADPKLRPHAAVSLSGVLDLAAAAQAPGDGRVADLRTAVTDFMGGPPAAVPDRYQQLSPIQMVALGIPQLVMHGKTDELVPFAQSTTYADAARRAGDTVTLAELPNVNHFDVVKSTKAYWDQVLNWLTATLGDPLR